MSSSKLFNEVPDIQEETPIDAPAFISRRAFIQGIASLVGLSVLEAMSSGCKSKNKSPERLPQKKSQEQEKSPLLKEKTVSPEKLKQQINEAMDRVFSLAESQTDSKILNEADREMLRNLNKFRKERVSWTELAGNSNVITELHPDITRGYMAIIPVGHSKMAEQPSFAAVEVRPDINLLTFMPLEVSTKYASTIIIHELRHFYDFATGQESKNPTKAEYFKGEVDAWGLQVAVANLVTEGKYKEMMSDLIKMYSTDLIDLLLADNTDPQTKSVLEKLDQTFGVEGSMSLVEKTNRRALYLITVVFYLTDQQPIAKEEKLKRKIALIEQFHDFALVKSPAR